jgi:segregation and condensation protein A
VFSCPNLFNSVADYQRQQAMTETPAQEAIALLIDLAQRGEINPWDVQVIEVIDRYLSELALGNETEPGRRDADLSQSGQAFLWASMLVLLKADTLGRLEESEDLGLTDEDEELDVGGQTRLPLHLERHLRRRAAAPPPKKRPVTLQELIDQLQQMAAQLGEDPIRSRSKPPRSVSRTQAAKAIAHLAHDENLTEIATRLEVFLSRHWQELSAGKDWLNLEQLLEWWTLSSVALDEANSLPYPTLSKQAVPTGTPTGNGNPSGEPDSYSCRALPTHLDNAEGYSLDPSTGNPNASHDSGADVTEPRAGDRVGVFWALLLLSAQSKVELSQEEFYQDLKIRTLT